MKDKKKILFLLILMFLFSAIVMILIDPKPLQLFNDDDKYYDEKELIENYFNNLLSNKHHQLELGAMEILLDEKIIDEIELLEISNEPIKGRANRSWLSEKYNNLENVIVFEIRYNIEYKKRFKYLATRSDGEYTQFITLIKLEGSDNWYIEEIGY